MRALLLEIQQQLRESQECLDHAGECAEDTGEVLGVFESVRKNRQYRRHNYKREEVRAVVPPVPEALHELVGLFLVGTVEGIHFDSRIILYQIYHLVTAGTNHCADEAAAAVDTGVGRLRGVVE